MQTLHQFFAKPLFILAIISMMAFWTSQLLGRCVWQLELFSHFVPYYAVICILAGLIYPKKPEMPSFLRKKTLNIHFLRWFFVLFGIILLLWCLPTYQVIALLEGRHLDKFSINKNHTSVFIAYQNVNIANNQKQRTLSELTKHNPSVLILIEAGGDWLPHLQPLKKTYPTHCGDEQNSPFAMQVYVKDHLATCKKIQLPKVSDMPLIKLDMGETIIYVAHPPPPVSTQLAHSRIHYLQGLRHHIQQENLLKDIIVIGDLNTTVFSPVYRDFTKNTKLQRTTAGMATWSPFKDNFGYVGLGIDHYLTTMVWHDNITLLNYNGSDHRGFLVD